MRGCLRYGKGGIRYSVFDTWQERKSLVLDKETAGEVRRGLERWMEKDEGEGGMGMGVLCITHEQEERKGGRGNGMRGWCGRVVELGECGGS